MGSTLTSGRIILTAAACALAVATPYYNQPMLPLVRESFGPDAGNGGAIATLTQVGYAAGLFLFVPLGDKLDYRRLIFTLLLANIVSLTVSAFAASLGVLLWASFAVGLTAPAAQIIIPAIGGLATPDERGKIIGILLTGLSSGVLLGRVISGVVSAHFGWRAMFCVAALLDIALIVIVWRLFPFRRPAASIEYGRLLRSMMALYLREPALRVASASGFLFFGAYNAIWGPLALLLSRPPYGFGADIVGVFGLASLAGLATSPAIGRLTDRFGPRTVAGAGSLVIMVAFGLISGTEQRLYLLIAGMALLDVGHRAGLVANQASIYSLNPDARSRLNTVFMSFFFIGGAAGTALGTEAGAIAGWKGLAFLGCGFAALAAIIHAAGGRRSARSPTASEEPTGV